MTSPLGGLPGPVGSAVVTLGLAAALAFLSGRKAASASGSAPNAERVGTLLSAGLVVIGALTVAMGGLWWLLGKTGGGGPHWNSLLAAGFVGYIAGVALGWAADRTPPRV